MSSCEQLLRIRRVQYANRLARERKLARERSVLWQPGYHELTLAARGSLRAEVQEGSCSVRNFSPPSYRTEVAFQEALAARITELFATSPGIAAKWRIIQPAGEQTIRRNS